ncbi:Astra associated protein 1 Asa1 [Saxophila tyrrhenica]|uniref:ASTRA-associated protein 1 n=1 Tax=Saxophila tyrrhenica TaxID=1690608 RepID=A0AAV9P055_9PEZI|nr:Astra associated protein 1 Asa1 [Saxophila tyrrhenica]
MATEAPHLIQSSALPPAQPAYVLRGHTAQIHSVHFLRNNLRLLSGDAEGWVALWDVPIRRPVAVWKAHQDVNLGVGSWGDDKIITHGRDSKLHVWQLRPEDEKDFSTVLPVNDSTTERKQPWLLHSLTLNTLNFCSFAMCPAHPSKTAMGSGEAQEESILVATPGVQDGFINITSLPGEVRVATIPTLKDVNTGMLMAVSILHQAGGLTAIAGYESGHAAVWQQNATSHWQTVYVNKAHSQPVLSLDICTQPSCFFTSSADAVIARHPLPGSKVETKYVQTKHAGQQALAFRSDQKIFATAGWDGRARVYSTQSMKQLAVLKWHKEGCYALAFAEIKEDHQQTNGSDEEGDAMVKRDLTVSQQRMEKAKTTHWLAAGSKDGKISLWDIY